MRGAIATVIATLQIKDALGLPIGRMPDSYVEKLAALCGARTGLSLPDLVVAAFTLSLLLLAPRVTRKVPAPLVAIVVSSAAAAVLHRYAPAFSTATIGTRFHATVAGHDVAEGLLMAKDLVLLSPEWTAAPSGLPAR